MEIQNIQTRYFNLILLLLISLIYLAINFYTKSYLLTDQSLYEFYARTLSMEQVERMLYLKNKYDWVDYLFIPLLLLLKIMIISSLIYVGIYVYDLKIRFQEIVQMVFTAELVFIVMSIVKVVFFTIKGNSSPEEIANFIPLSVYQLLKRPAVYVRYPTQILNLFEAAYFLALTIQLKNKLRQRFFKCLELVFITYGLGLLVWISLIVFLQVVNT
jgi:hypothetical protein